ncbi:MULTISPECIES: hypothetical protein [unclassified Mucilaginibacter]|nr:MULTISPECIES: hypothetical protein [unclassified Mucilaginibacter]MEB0263233.1 hypothetical protein [Mucilaginibacter sp. 10I4]MEB0280320.1 hypothetical protein [Mucilaginibacter sp. 10B2]MEB0300265.1 hypothetical protein [Mucilaginibacter sp. 5C4]WPX25622.1 hypothetical protein RHM67_10125 [Mucilaginibacter sp. 5C4]
MQSLAYSSVLAADGVINDKNSKKISLTTKKLSVCYQLEITSTG